METALKNSLRNLMPKPIVKRNNNLVAVSKGESGALLLELRRLPRTNTLEAIKRTINPMSNGEAISDLGEATADRLLPSLLTENEWKLAFGLWKKSTEDAEEEITEAELELIEAIAELTANDRTTILEAMNGHFYGSFDEYDEEHPPKS